MLSKGEIVYVISRRLFERDLRRHFVGEVQEVSERSVRVCGYAFIYDDATNGFVRREDIRTRVFSLVDAAHVIMVLPPDVIPAEVRFGSDDRNHRVITDGKSFTMNVSEFGPHR